MSIIKTEMAMNFPSNEGLFLIANKELIAKMMLVRKKM